MPHTDRYQSDRDESPTCFVQVSLGAPGDSERFLKIVSDLAARLDLAPRPSPVTPQGRSLPGGFESADLLLLPSIFELPNPAANYAQVRLQLRRGSFPRDQFIRIGNEFNASIRSEFGSQVRMAGAD